MVELDEDCRRQQLGEGWFASLEDVPRRAISMSIRQILKSREILCVVPDARKARAVKECLGGAVSPRHPASILQRHPRTTVFLDAPAAALLGRGRWRDERAHLRPRRTAGGGSVARTTHMGIVAHPDDLEILAYPGILECLGKDDRWFCGVVATDGRGSARSGPTRR